MNNKQKMFLYRASQLAQWMESSVNEKLTSKDCAEALNQLIERIMDPSKCNACCKDLYWCDLPKNHKGSHAEGCLMWERGYK